MLKQRYLNFILSFLIITFISTPIANAATTSTATPVVTNAAPTSTSTNAAPTSTPANAVPSNAVPTPTPTNTALNPIGEVIISSGTFTDIDQNKQTRTLTRGSKFYNGDTLITAAASKAQVRYTDGSVLALDPNSQFKITDYHYQQPGLKDKNFARLIKGGFRALTGLISKQDPTAFQVDTTVAAIAVRGTSFGASLKNGQLYIGVWKGKIVVENAAGTIILGEGQNYDYATVMAANSSPIGLLSEPDALAGSCIQTFN